jgi:hypothetical protein
LVESQPQDVVLVTLLPALDSDWLFHVPPPLLTALPDAEPLPVASLQPVVVPPA